MPMVASGAMVHSFTNGTVFAPFQVQLLLYETVDIVVVNRRPSPHATPEICASWADVALPSNSSSPYGERLSARTASFGAAEMSSVTAHTGWSRPVAKNQ